MTTSTSRIDVDQHGSAAARRAFELLMATTPTPLMRRLHRHGLADPIQEIRVVGRRSGIERSFLAVVAEIGGAMYIGHPNGHRAHWVRNLLRAGSGTVVGADGSTTAVRATELAPGAERTAVIDAHRAAQRQPFRALYRHYRAHVIATGAFFRLDPTD